jgi:hypothetical protein
VRLNAWGGEDGGRAAALNPNSWSINQAVARVFASRPRKHAHTSAYTSALALQLDGCAFAMRMLLGKMIPLCLCGVEWAREDIDASARQKHNRK